jgi:Transposase
MIEDISAFVGVDWASATHYAYALDADGRKLGHRSFPHSGEGLAELANWIRITTGHEPDHVAIGIEVPHGPVVEGLMDAGFLVPSTPSRLIACGTASPWRAPRTTGSMPSF